MPSQRSSYADIQGGEDQDVGADRRSQAPDAGGDFSLAAAHLRFLRGERWRSASHRPVHRRTRIDHDDAPLLPRKRRRAEMRGQRDTLAIVQH